MTENERKIVAILDSYVEAYDANLEKQPDSVACQALRSETDELRREVLDVVDPFVDCPDCGGAGSGMSYTPTDRGVLEELETCETCDARGEVRGSLVEERAAAERENQEREAAANEELDELEEELELAVLERLILSGQPGASTGANQIDDLWNQDGNR